MAHARKLSDWDDVFNDHVKTNLPNGWVKWAKPHTNIDSIYYLVFSSYLVVIGDLGDAIYRWSTNISLEWVSKCDLYYFTGKCQASEVGRTGKDYCPEIAVQRLQEEFNSIDKDNETLPSDEIKELRRQALNEAANSEFEWLQWLNYDFSDDAVKLFGDDYWEYGDIGSAPHVRVVAHLAGLKAMFKDIKQK